MSGMIVEGLAVAQGGQRILHDVSFSLSPGEACIILGPNGSGKTTLLRSLLRLHPLQAGRIQNDFHRCGYVPQARTLDPSFPVTVRGALEMSFPGPMLHAARRKQVRQAIGSALASVGIGELSHKLLRECSGGQLQKALLARALVHRPQLIVLDEPTNSLDQAGKEDLIRLLSQFRAERTAILMTTHESEIAADALFDSELVIDGTSVSKIERRPRGGTT